jgi:catechol 2,3-dioxygenase-like lactoylglutathione lyase family enzyme
MTARVHHVNLIVPRGTSGDVASFYRDLFGYTDLDGRPTGQGNGGWWLAFGDGTQLHLSENDGGAHPSAHFAIEVDDLPTTRDALDRRGVEIVRDEGTERCFVRDPGGNLVEVRARDDE